MKKLTIILLLIMVTMGVSNATDYSKNAFWEKIRSVKSNEEADPLFVEFIGNTMDYEFAWELFSMWQSRREVQAAEFYTTLQSDEKYKDRIWYFEGVQKKRLVDRIAYSRKRMDEDKDAFEAYALMFDTYTRWLFQKRLEVVNTTKGPSAEELDELEKGFDDNMRMVRVRKWKESGQHLSSCLKYMAYYGEYKKHYDDAYKFFKEAEELGAGWVNPVHIAVQAVRLKKFDEVDPLINQFVDRLIENRMIKPDMRMMVFDDVMLRTLVIGKSYDKAIERVKARDGYQTNSMSLYDLAAVYYLKGDRDLAFQNLFNAVENGFNDVDLLVNDPDFKGIKTHPSWPELEKKLAAKWKAGEADRARAAVAQKIDKPAADWSLKDPQGKTWKLSDYAGKKVVILDFWATWCSPCMQAMPALDDWCKKHKPADVEVFSINTWERNPEKAKKLFIDKKYAMHLLMDGNTAAQEYGVSGIPYICIIGKDGKIHYEVKGFSPDLEQNLTYWVQDLLK